MSALQPRFGAVVAASPSGLSPFQFVLVISQFLLLGQGGTGLTHLKMLGTCIWSQPHPGPWMGPTLPNRTSSSPERVFLKVAWKRAETSERGARVLAGPSWRVLPQRRCESGTQETASQPVATHFFCPRQGGGVQGSRHLLVPARDRGLKGASLGEEDRRII